MEAFLKVVSEQKVQTPKTWSKFPGVSDWDSTKGHKSRSAGDFLVKCDSKTSNAIKQLIKNSWDQLVNIDSVQRIENPELFCKYDAHRRRYCGRASQEPFSPISPEVRTLKYSSPLLDQQRIAEVNEYYFFHGSKDKFKDPIITKGFDFRFAGNGLFGKGVYMAEEVKKSDGYSGER